MDEKNNAPLASEMYADLKAANKFKDKLIYILLGVVAVLIIALAAISVYHDRKWSEFETVYVGSEDGGNANYVGGDNIGGINNGESDSPTEAKGQPL